MVMTYAVVGAILFVLWVMWDVARKGLDWPGTLLKILFGMCLCKVGIHPIWNALWTMVTRIWHLFAGSF